MKDQELNDAQWEQIRPLLPAQKPRVGRPNKDHRTVLSGIIWILRTGAPWKDLPERFGPTKTVSSTTATYNRGRSYSSNVEEEEEACTGWTG